MEQLGNQVKVQIRNQSLGEEVFNGLSHGLGALLAVWGTVLMILRALRHSSVLGVVSAAFYGASMVLLYLFSCLYHAVTAPRGKKVLQILDHCAIFLLILGTYIPIALLGVGGLFGWIVFGVIAACAVLGIVLNAVDLHRFKKMSMVLYIVMGWLAIITIGPIYHRAGTEGIVLLLVGGLCYTLGVVFYKKKQIPYMHFVWHLFVLGGSVFHFLMIYQYFCY